MLKNFTRDARGIKEWGKEALESRIVEVYLELCVSVERSVEFEVRDILFDHTTSVGEILADNDMVFLSSELFHCVEYALTEHQLQASVVFIAWADGLGNEPQSLSKSFALQENLFCFTLCF